MMCDVVHDQAHQDDLMRWCYAMCHSGGHCISLLADIQVARGVYNTPEALSQLQVECTCQSKFWASREQKLLGVCWSVDIE
eukprot:6338415-Amphidinium_carterae.1